MIVISDTTPIISLVKINQLPLLKKLFDEVYIPTAVYDELIADERFHGEAEQIQTADYIIPTKVRNEKQVQFLQRVSGLDLGESEAIILSDEMNTDLLLMDEVAGRNVAKNMGLHLMGTIGMLQAAYVNHLLTSDEIRECIALLQNNGRHISERLYKKLLSSLKD